MPRAALRSPVRLLAGVPAVVLVCSLVGACGVGPSEAPGAAAADGVWLLAGGIVLTMDAEGAVYDPGAVAVRGARIEAVGGAEELRARFPGAPERSADGGIVVPGLINAHTHVPMTLLRGVADDLPLMEWLEDVIFPAEAEHVDEEFVRWGTRLACLEMIRGGTTTFVDMYYYEDAIAEEAELCGLRAVVGQTLIDFPAPDHPTWEEAVAYSERFLERWRGHERITPAVAPHAPYTVSAEHLREAHGLAAAHDAPLLIHLAEARSELEQILDREGMRPVDYADSLGILDERVLAAHMVWPSAGEIELLAARGVGVAHCPQSNMKVAAGAAPVPELLAAGVAVGLGTDGPASNNDLDMWQEMDTAAKLHKLTSMDPTRVSARRALAMATREGARAIGQEAEIGSLEPGKRADLVVVDAGGYHMRPLYDPYSALVYAARAADVRDVWVDGVLLLEAGAVRRVDVAAVLAKAEEYRERISATVRNAADSGISGVSDEVR